MTITNEDGTKVVVKICDLHAEEATVKSAREAYNDRLDKIKQVMEQAKALGLNIEENKSGLVVADKAARLNTPQPESRQESTKPSLLIDPSDPNVIETSRLNTREFKSVTGAVQGQSLESHQAYDASSLKDKLDPTALEGYAQMAINEGRAGQQIAIPAIRQDRTGTTTIIINKAENDATLQARSKRLAQASMGDDSMSYKDGYAGIRPCPLCRGVGFINNGRTRPACPKCKGSGTISQV